MSRSALIAPLTRHQISGPSGQPWTPLQKPHIGAVRMQRTMLQAWARERDVHLVTTVETHGVNPQIGLSGAAFPTATLLVETTRAIEKCDPQTFHPIRTGRTRR